MFLRKSSDALDLLTEAKLERRFRPPGRDLSSLYAGYYVAELLNELTDDYDPHPELFDAANERLSNCALRRQSADVLALRADRPADAGHLPSLEACVECGTPVDRAAACLFVGGGRSPVSNVRRPQTGRFLNAGVSRPFATCRAGSDVVATAGGRSTHLGELRAAY